MALVTEKDLVVTTHEALVISDTRTLSCLSKGTFNIPTPHTNTQHLPHHGRKAASSDEQPVALVSGNEDLRPYED